MVDWVCCGNMFTVGTRDISVDSRSMLDRYIGRQSVDSRPIVGRYSDQLWAECQDQFLFLGNRPREKNPCSGSVCTVGKLSSVDVHVTYTV